MSENTQEPKREFRGVWIPVEICQLVVEGEITAHQAFLAATIDSLVSEDRGCYASNEYLAQCTGSTAKAVSNAISHLKKKGLVWQTGFDGRTRYLETAWSRLMQGPRKVDAGPIKSGCRANQKWSLDQSLYSSSDKTVDKTEHKSAGVSEPPPSTSTTTPKGRFTPPTTEEVAAYCKEKGYTCVDPETFVAYYESVGWKVNGKKMVSWRAAVVTWKKRNEQNGNTNGNGAMKLAGRYVEGPDGRKWLLGRDPGPESGLGPRERTILHNGYDPFRGS